MREFVNVRPPFGRIRLSRNLFANHLGTCRLAVTNTAWQREKAAGVNSSGLRHIVAAHTGLEPVISALRGQRVNQLHQCAAVVWDYRCALPQ